MKREILQSVLAARADRTAIAVVTMLESGNQRLVPLNDVAGDELEAELRNAFRFDKFGTVTWDDTTSPHAVSFRIGETSLLKITIDPNGRVHAKTGD